MIKEGDFLPNITLRSVAEDGTRDFNLHEKFEEKNTLILCIPGAFTSTCHIQHLPPFIKGSKKLMVDKKLDYLCCVSTNDPYVLDLWRTNLGKSEITFLSDGNLEFLNSTQLVRNYDKSFMGNRLIRSVILSKNLKVTKLIHDNPGKLDKTSFDSILKTI